MEENKQNAEPVVAATPAPTPTPAPVPAEPTAPVPAASPSAPVKASNTPLWIGLGVLAVIVIAAVAVAVVLLLNNQQRAAGSLAALNPGNPEQAVQLINEQIKGAVLAIASGDITKIGETFDGFAVLENAEFTMTINAEEDGTKLDMEFSGKASKGSDGKSNFEGSLTIGGYIPDFGNISPAMKMDMIIVGDTLYLKVTDLPADFRDLLTLFGLSQGAWYSLPIDSTTSGIADSVTGPALSSTELAELEKTIQDKNVFVNPKAKADRNIGGTNTKCMSVEINPELGESAELGANPPIEICSPENELFPLFFGVDMDQDGSKINFSFTIKPLSGSVSITAPAGAQDLEAMLSALSGASMFGDPSYDYDYDYDEDYDWDYDWDDDSMYWDF